MSKPLISKIVSANLLQASSGFPVDFIPAVYHIDNMLSMW
jgi:hypothetical protein